jgi:hypothetical protein
VLLKKDGDGIKILMDAPDFFDDAIIDMNHHSDNHDNHVDDADIDDKHIKSISLTSDSLDAAELDGIDDPAPFLILAIHDDDEVRNNLISSETTLYIMIPVLNS